MSEMIERVARAIYAQMPNFYMASVPSTSGGRVEQRYDDPWEDAADRHEDCRRQARIAIAAMREPTEAMKTADGVHWDFNCGVCGGIAEGWAKLIDEALK